MNPQSDNSSPLPLPAVPGTGKEQPNAFGSPQASSLAPVPAGNAPVSAVDQESVQTIIAKGRQLMEQQNANPYHQNQALQLLKAQYIAERYHINLKVVPN